jgi:FtsP/CotA-like multicopper oxidase with cupredoxin domain
MMGSEVWTINGKSAPYTDPILVHQGERIRLKLFNMSMQDHPMHLHGHTFQVVAIGGRSVDGPLKDTITLHPMEQYEIEFVANNPGDWLFHCHRLDHMEGGLMTEIRYQ